MWVGRAMYRIAGAITATAQVMNIIGGVFLALLLLVVVVDVLGRFAFNHPLKGSVELVQLTEAVVISFSFAYAMVRGGHISIGIISSRFSGQARATFDAVIYFIGLATISTITWRIFLYQEIARSRGSRTMIWLIPISPFQLMTCLAFGVLSLVLLMQFVNSLIKVTKANE